MRTRKENAKMRGSELNVKTIVVENNDCFFLIMNLTLHCKGLTSERLFVEYPLPLVIMEIDALLIFTISFTRLSGSMTSSQMKRITTEEEAKAALAERRRQAREQAEREAEFEQRRLVGRISIAVEYDVRVPELRAKCFKCAGG